MGRCFIELAAMTSVADKHRLGHTGSEKTSKWRGDTTEDLLTGHRRVNLEPIDRLVGESNRFGKC